ncbi:endolytic transglycosylase MltG [Nonomuraea sp. K274]|uniref:Endolytic murein transglycosylase n=1 Tax=Nonomuraea cypriaca TaxID=1187855 RepID=A0A931ALV4_9ACTN|nr:endolytic transglycosylase MltG [Nonomuraea cypriaca]MBF8192794.1 endolytic transglycosylase MltG [Nonomuraea cypriaca]
MSVEDLLRETLADMAHEEPPPHPDRFLRPLRIRRAHRRGATLAAAAAVVALAMGATIAVQTLSETSRPVAPTAVRPEPVRSKVTVKEGLRLTDLLDRLARLTGKPVESFAKAAEDGRTPGLPTYAKGRLEGFAYPGTYEYTASSTPAEILAAMVARFGESAAELGLDAEPAPLDVVIIASLVQAEAPSEADMPKVARVIRNRLARDMKLQLDSPLLYGLGTYGTTARLKDLKSRTPYNTYRYRGLPPGPISNPGEAALKAALHPAPGPWLYYVATDPKRGTLEYATSEAEFAALLERAAD